MKDLPEKHNDDDKLNNFNIKDSISIPLIANYLFEGSEPLDNESMKALKDVIKNSGSKESQFDWIE